jgi:hypothetical protein
MKHRYCLDHCQYDQYHDICYDLKFSEDFPLEHAFGAQVTFINDTGNIKSLNEEEETNMNESSTIAVKRSKIDEEEEADLDDLNNKSGFLDIDNTNRSEDNITAMNSGSQHDDVEVLKPAAKPIDNMTLVNKNPNITVCIPVTICCVTNEEILESLKMQHPELADLQVISKFLPIRTTEI